MAWLKEKFKEAQYRVKLRLAYNKATKKELEIALDELTRALERRKKKK